MKLTFAAKAAAVAGLLWTLPFTASGVVLYDPGLNSLPNAQGWLAAGDPLFGNSATATMTPDGAEVDTTANRTHKFGYFSELFGVSALPVPVLDRGVGFSLSFDLQVLEETHDLADRNSDGKSDRAGFSVILISDDLRGIEVSFFSDKIWVQEDGHAGTNTLFTQAESIDFDTDTDLTSYELTVQDDSYILSGNEVELLTGNLRNYNPNNIDAPFNVYATPNFLFFGDNTSSAESNVVLGEIAIAPIPLPAPALLLLSGLAALVWSRHRRERTPDGHPMPDSIIR